MPIGAVARIINGFPFKSDRFTDRDEGVPIIRIRDVTVGRSKTNYVGEIPEGIWVDDGDLVVGMDGDFNSRVWAGGRGLLNQRVCKIVPDPAVVDLSFLAAVLPGYLSLINEATHSITVKHLSSRTLADTPIPLPPLPEQRRIVAKLDRLSARSRAARDHLARTAKLAARAKQAILDAAFSAGWPTAELRTMVDPVRGIPYGIVQTGTHTPGGVPTIRCGDIKQFSVAKEGLKLVEQRISDDYRRTILRGGEVLIAIRGSVGETCIVPESLAGCNISREVAMIPVIGTVSASFVMYFLRSREAARFILANIKGVAQTGINLADLRTLPTPILALEEQERVVRAIEAAFARIDRLTAEAARAAHLLDRLDERLLAKAFRGELVPQDPADEPAEALLARIHRARAQAPKPRRGRRTRTG